MATPSPLTRRYVLITGKVQGVGYRWFVHELARSLSVTGWVRNRPDEAVEAEVEGAIEPLEEFLRRLKDGNPAARVDKIVCVPRTPEGGSGFDIRR